MGLFSYSEYIDFANEKYGSYEHIPRGKWYFKYTCGAGKKIKEPNSFLNYKYILEKYPNSLILEQDNHGP